MATYRRPTIDNRLATTTTTVNKPTKNKRIGRGRGRGREAMARYGKETSQQTIKVIT